MDNWTDVIKFLADKLENGEELADYYRAECERLRAENIDLRTRLDNLESQTCTEVRNDA